MLFNWQAQRQAGGVCESLLVRFPNQFPSLPRKRHGSLKIWPLFSSKHGHEPQRIAPVRGNQRFLVSIFRDEVRQTDAQFVAREQLALVDRLAVDVCPVARAEVANLEPVCDLLDAAMTATEPAIVDPDGGSLAAAQLDGELVDDDFARSGQGVPAEQFEFHVSGTGKVGLGRLYVEAG